MIKLDLDCQNNHYEIDLLGNSTFKPIPYSSWIKNNTKHKPLRRKIYRTDLLPLIEKENLTDNINLSGLPDIDSKYTKNQVFNLHYPLDNRPLSKLKIENIFLPNTEKLILELLQKYQNLDPMKRELKSWYNYKTKPIKADITILGNKTLLRYFRKIIKTSINENTKISEHQTSELKVRC